MGWIPKEGEPIKVNKAFHVDMSILCFDVALGAEAKLCALFHNCQIGTIFQSILENLGHPQQKMSVHCNNAMAVGIANSSVKRWHLSSMEMRFFLISGKVPQDMYALSWHPGQENPTDYQSKHHMGCHHVAAHPWYLHMENSPRFLPRAQIPSALKGCVGTLDDGYLCKDSLPRAPRIQIPGHVTCAAVRARDKRLPAKKTSTHKISAERTSTCKQDDTCYLQVPCIPTWNDLVRSHAGLAWSTMLQVAPVWLMWALTN